VFIAATESERGWHRLLWLVATALLAACAPYEREEPLAGKWCVNGELRAEITHAQITYYGVNPPRTGEWVRETGGTDGEMSVHWLSGVDWGDGTYNETLRYQRAGRWLTLESEAVQMPFTMEACK